jgi:energy-coupling factor transport system permease protein
MAQITYAIEDMLRPFARLGVPAHEISLVGAITLRFVPLLAEQMETIMKAQASRGARVAASGRFGFVDTARSALVFIVPLFLDAFARAEDLIVAMEARCYTGGRGRTRLAQLQMRAGDLIVLGLAVICAAGFIVLARRFPF